MLPRLLLPAISAILAASPLAYGVIVAIDNSATYTTPPADNFGFGNVGTVFNTIGGFPASGVYLGDGWMISAFHNVSNGSGAFAFGPITLGGLVFAADAGSATRLHNPDTTLTDLAIFRLTTVPAGLPSINLAGIAPPLNAPLRMAGNGQNRLATQTRWQVTGSTWTEVGAGGNALGYKLDPLGSRALRWGNNNVETSPAPLASLGYGSVFAAFTTDFGDNSISIVNGEAQATPGDSGGGVFRKNGSTWELAGIILYTFPNYANQPAGTAVYGNLTYSASIATYKAEIESTMLAMPEPATTTLLAAGAGLLARRRRGALRGKS
jgi:hypothetical protein